MVLLLSVRILVLVRNLNNCMYYNKYYACTVFLLQYSNIPTFLGGCNIPGEEDSWDFGTGAGFYVDATQDPWKDNYQMYTYITEELSELIASNFPVKRNKQSIMGHRY